MFRTRLGRISRTALLGFGLLAGLFIPLSLSAQSCALCYQSAAASSVRFIRALQGGILVLLVPTVLIGAGISLVSYRKRDVCGEEEVSAKD